jgi:hypothetical protein
MTELPELQPDEEREHQAMLALQEVAKWADILREQADILREQSERKEQVYRKLFEAMPDESQERVIWRGIIGFANASRLEVSTSPSRLAGCLDPAETNKFLYLLKLCDQSLFQDDDLGMESFDEVHRLAGELLKRSQLNALPPDAHKAMNIFAFTVLTNQYQPQLRRFLIWLCEPQTHPELRIEAVDFLAKHARGVDVSLEYSEVNFDENSSYYCASYYTKAVQYQSVMSPICKFIFDRIERYHEWLDRIPGKKIKRYRANEDEIAREKAIPIRLCEKPGCGKFMLPQRTGRKRFCSQQCCGDSQPGRIGEENKDYMWVYRLEKRSPAVLRSKLKPPASKRRLARIEKMWPDLASRVKTLRKQAGLGV